MSLPAAAPITMNSECRLRGCTVNHLHPITGAQPDYHWHRDNGTNEPRWRDPFKGHPKPAEWYFRVPELARIAGVTKWTVRRWITECGLPAHKAPGGRIFYVQGKEFDVWLRSRSTIALVPGGKRK